MGVLLVLEKGVGVMEGEGVVVREYMVDLDVGAERLVGAQEGRYLVFCDVGCVAWLDGFILCTVCLIFGPMSAHSTASAIVLHFQ